MWRWCIYLRALNLCNSSCLLASSPCTFSLNVQSVFAFSNSTCNLFCVDLKYFCFLSWLGFWSHFHVQLLSACYWELLLILAQSRMNMFLSSWDQPSVNSFVVYSGCFRCQPFPVSLYFYNFIEEKLSHDTSPLQVQGLSTLSEPRIIADVAFTAGVSEMFDA